MVRPDVLRRKLDDLDEILSILRDLQDVDLDAFLTDPTLYGSTERFLQLAIEVVNDLGSHVIADEDLGSVDAYGDIPAILAETKDLPGEARDTWTEMIGFRNVLVHRYAEIDRRIVHRHLQGGLEDLERIQAWFATLL